MPYRNVKWTARWGIAAYGSACVKGLCARVFHWAVEICWRMNLQMTKATTMQSCGQTIRMGGWQWPQGIRERTRHIKVKHLYWVMPSHWKEWIGANARLSHSILCESLQSHWCAIFLWQLAISFQYIDWQPSSNGQNLVSLAIGQSACETLKEQSSTQKKWGWLSVPARSSPRQI